MMLRRCELGTVVHFLGLVAEEPVLAGFEAADERVPGGLRMRGRVLHRRGVAAADVPALGAPGTARRHRRIDARYLTHSALLSIILRGNRQPHPEPRVTRRRHQ